MKISGQLASSWFCSLFKKSKNMDTLKNILVYLLQHKQPPPKHRASKYQPFSQISRFWGSGIQSGVSWQTFLLHVASTRVPGSHSRGGRPGLECPKGLLSHIWHSLRNALKAGLSWESQLQASQTALLVLWSLLTWKLRIPERVLPKARAETAGFY